MLLLNLNKIRTPHERFEQVYDPAQLERDPDYTSHANTYYMDWLLPQIYTHDSANAGQRVLDVFSMHWYPSGNEFSNDTSNTTELLRNVSTRALWDPAYADPSLVDPDTGTPAHPDFIHRMSRMMDRMEAAAH